jgi:hypothetical protein
MMHFKKLRLAIRLVLVAGTLTLAAKVATEVTAVEPPGVMGGPACVVPTATK